MDQNLRTVVTVATDELGAAEEGLDDVTVRVTGGVKVEGEQGEGYMDGCLCPVH